MSHDHWHGGRSSKPKIAKSLHARSVQAVRLSASMVVADRTVRNSAPEMPKATSASSRILNDGHRAIGEAVIILTNSLSFGWTN